MLIVIHTKSVSTWKEAAVLHRHFPPVARDLVMLSLHRGSEIKLDVLKTALFASSPLDSPKSYALGLNVSLPTHDRPQKMP